MRRHVRQFVKKEGKLEDKLFWPLQLVRVEQSVKLFPKLKKNSNTPSPEAQPSPSKIM